MHSMNIIPYCKYGVSRINYKYEFILGLNFVCSSKGGILINCNYVTFFKRAIVSRTDFYLSHFSWHQHVHSELHADCGGISNSCFDFSHDLEIEICNYFIFQYDLIIETCKQHVDNFLGDLERPYINKEIDFYDLDLEDFCNLNFILKKIDIQIKRTRFFKKIKKQNLEEIIWLAETTQVLREDPIKYWDRNKFKSHLDIKKFTY